jgi:hypothetical protein
MLLGNGGSSTSLNPQTIHTFEGIKMSRTDEIDEVEVSQEVDEVLGSTTTSKAANTWGDRLSEYAVDADKYQQQFTQEQLGHGQSLDAVSYAKQMTAHQGRERAGNAKAAGFKADRAWVNAAIEEEKLTGAKLKHGIQLATNVVLGNELKYRVGVIPLHGELRHNQLQALSNKVRSTRISVQAGSEALAIGGVSGEGIDFTALEVEAEEVSN